MPTQTYYFSGKALFPHLSSPDTKFDKAGIWHVGLILDDESKAAYAASGIQVTPKPVKRDDPNSPLYVRFSRKTQQIMKNELVKFAAPEVVDANNQPLSALVGNDSKLTVKVSVFDTMRGKGHRLDKVRVDELIEYKPEPKAEAPATTAPKGTIPF